MEANRSHGCLGGLARKGHAVAEVIREAEEVGIGSKPVAEHDEPGKGMLKRGGVRERASRARECSREPATHGVGQGSDAGKGIKAALGPPQRPIDRDLAASHGPSMMADRGHQQGKGAFLGRPRRQIRGWECVKEAIFLGVVRREQREGLGDVAGDVARLQVALSLKSVVELSDVVERGERGEPRDGHVVEIVPAREHGEASAEQGA